MKYKEFRGLQTMGGESGNLRVLGEAVRYEDRTGIDLRSWPSTIRIPQIDGNPVKVIDPPRGAPE
ncbi:MAG TPA: hypothetical protein VJU02_08045 [Nitrospiraceae bacterium]|nr:hypothetical protein [Nitrospiraceae bacterium]